MRQMFRISRFFVLVKEYIVLCVPVVTLRVLPVANKAREHNIQISDIFSRLSAKLNNEPQRLQFIKSYIIA